MAEELYKKLKEKDIQTTYLHGDLELKERKKAINKKSEKLNNFDKNHRITSFTIDMLAVYRAPIAAPQAV